MQAEAEAQTAEEVGAVMDSDVKMTQYDRKTKKIRAEKVPKQMKPPANVGPMVGFRQVIEVFKPESAKLRRGGN